MFFFRSLVHLLHCSLSLLKVHFIYLGINNNLIIYRINMNRKCSAWRRRQEIEWARRIFCEEKNTKKRNTQLFFIVLCCRHCWNGWCCIFVETAICLSVRVHSVPVYKTLCVRWYRISIIIFIFSHTGNRKSTHVLSMARAYIRAKLLITRYLWCVCAPNHHHQHQHHTTAAQSRSAFR